MSPRIGGQIIGGHHKETHQDGGADEISIADLAGESAELATHAALAIAHGTVDDIADQTDIATHAALATGVHSLNKGARAYNDADQSIPNNTPTIIALNSERYDTDAIHDLVTNNSRLTCKTAGKYVISFSGDFAANVDGRRSYNIKLNGTTFLAGTSDNPNSGGGFSREISTIYELAVNDYVEVEVWQSSGDALNLATTANRSPEFSMQRIG